MAMVIVANTTGMILAILSEPNEYMTIVIVANTARMVSATLSEKLNT